MTPHPTIERLYALALRLLRRIGLTRKLDDRIRELEEQNYLLGWQMMNTVSALKEQLRAAEFRADNWELYAKRNENTSLKPNP